MSNSSKSKDIVDLFKVNFCISKLIIQCNKVAAVCMQQVVLTDMMTHSAKKSKATKECGKMFGEQNLKLW